MPGPRIVLVRSRNALNMGAAARAMANFGLSDLVLVAPYAEAWTEARSARAGAAILRRARAVATLAEALDGCSVIVGTTDGNARTPKIPLAPWVQIAAALPPAGTALVFGSEKFGLSQDDISHCTHLARLPTRPDAPSMNLGQAVAVCAYELARCPPPPLVPTPATGAAAISPADTLQRERILSTWEPLLERINAVRPQHRASQTRTLRAMLARWPLSPADAQRLLGIARQLRHALDGHT